MRMNSAYEAYLDQFDTVNVYMSKNFFGGSSRSFHLKDSKDHLLRANIESKTELPNNYVHYVLKLEEPLEIGEEYTVFDEHCKTTPAQYAHIVKTKRFSDLYAYDGDDLGVTYTKKATTFKLWAPSAHRIRVLLERGGRQESFEMKREDHGIFAVKVPGDWKDAHYTFMVRVNGAWKETTDPYTSFSGPNGAYSVVVDESELKLPEKIALPAQSSNTDAIIYEASVRDMTSQTGVGVEHPRKFMGFVEENETTKQRNTGFSYLKSLGVTHVQLLPVFDFGSVDENYPDMYYNWGYDPVQYRVPEGSYAVDPADAKGRVEELAHLVHEAHKAGLKVNLDLVFNHVYDMGTNPLDIIVPGYYFLMNQNGDFSNGSFCGNDIDTQPVMSRRYFLDTCRRIVELYDVDGFRFDLMGILDHKLMNEIATEMRKIKPDFMVYGEGWNMPSFVEEGLRATQKNQIQMEEVGFFSDEFRNIIRGDNGDLYKRGYASGNFDNMNGVIDVMTANTRNGTYSSPEKVVNFVECHDNHTLWDKNRAACQGESREEREKRQIMANALVLMAQGIPFIHAGQEFGRTKQNIGNSYNRSDNVNRVDYFRRDRHKYIVDQTKELIRIRREHPALRLKTAEEIRSNTSFETVDNQLLVYRANKDDDHLVMFFNPGRQNFDYDLRQNSKVLFDSENANPKEAGLIHIPAESIVICELI